MIVHVLSIVVLSSGCLSPAARAQATPASDATDDQHPKARLELSAPAHPVHAWAASEWNLRIDNLGSEGLPFGPPLLGYSGIGFGGAQVAFEIAKDGESPSYAPCGPRPSEPPRPKPADLLAPGDHGDLLVVLHGDLGFGIPLGEKDGYGPFVPYFATPGVYSVTAVLLWNGNRSRSNTVKLEVEPAPPGSKAVLEALGALAKDGCYLDVQGMGYSPPYTKLDRIVELVDAEQRTLYGEQLRVGLALALLDLIHDQAGEAAPARLPSGVSVTFEQVKSLLAHDFPVDFGLDRTLAQLRSDVAAEERSRNPRR